MKIAWSKKWKGSSRPAKQRKYKFNAPLHVRHTFLGTHLSPILRKKYGQRSVTLRKGDLVKILRGEHKKRTGKVNKIRVQSQKVYIEGIERIKKDGNKVFVPVHPSNLMVMELELGDKKRKAKFERLMPKEKK